MKTILVATDNSKLANNALNYAIELAEDVKASITLLTSYEIVIATSYDVAFTAPSSVDIESAISESHQKTINQIKSSHPAITINSLIVQGNSADVIINTAQELNVPFVVMGISGMGYISRLILGSTIRSVVHENKVPVLAIPEGAKYNGLKNMVFAFDYANFNRNKLEPFVELLHVFKSKLIVVNVVNNLDDINTEKAISGLTLENMLYDIDHTYHYPSNENTTNKIIEFCTEFKADCLTLIPHHHSLLDKLFSSTTTDKLLNNLSIPILTLPD